MKGVHIHTFLKGVCMHTSFKKDYIFIPLDWSSLLPLSKKKKFVSAVPRHQKNHEVMLDLM